MMRSSGSTPIQPGMNPLRVSGGTVGGAAAATTGRAGQAIAGGYLSRNVTSAPGASSPAAAAAMPMPAQPPHAPPPTVAAAGQHGRTGAGGGRERSVSGGSSSAPRPSAAPGQPRAGPGTGIEEEGTGEFAMQDQDFPALLSHAQAAAGEAQRAAEYGLQGLVRVIRMLEPDLNILTLGTDLTTLGLNLNSPEALHPSFTSPWTDAQQPARVASGVATGGPSEYALPPCYLVQAPMQPASLKIHLFSDDTLFYIFYSHPRDYLQMLAAHELYKRDWRYHREMQRWLMRAPGTEPTFKSQTHEKGIYVFWDPDRAEKVRKELVVFYDLLETREPH
jgi:CCR4-NOT transcription complex subunit 2